MCLPATWAEPEHEVVQLDVPVPDVRPDGPVDPVKDVEVCIGAVTVDVLDIPVLHEAVDDPESQYRFFKWKKSFSFCSSESRMSKMWIMEKNLSFR